MELLLIKWACLRGVSKYFRYVNATKYLNLIIHLRNESNSSLSFKSSTYNFIIVDNNKISITSKILSVFHIIFSPLFSSINIIFFRSEMIKVARYIFHNSVNYIDFTMRNLIISLIYKKKKKHYNNNNWERVKLVFPFYLWAHKFQHFKK